MENQTNNEPRGPWKAFAIAGFASGFVAFFASFIPMAGLYLGLGFGIPGLVLSCLGTKSVIQHNKAVTGIVLNSIGCFLAILMFALYVFVIIKNAAY